MQAVLAVVGPVFAIIGLGWFSAWRGLIDRAGFAGLNRFVFTYCAPALLFLGGTSGGVAGGRAAFAFFLGAFAIYGTVLLAARRRLPLGDAGMLALDSCFGNTLMMGLPLILAAFGQEGLSVLLGILVLHSMVLLGLATMVAELALHARAPWRRVLRAVLAGMARNPVVVAVFAALLWRLLGLPAPGGVARRIMEMLGAAAPAAALFCLGGSLAGFDARAVWRSTLVATAAKLLVMPALVWGLARLFALSPLETAVAVVAAALPTGANAFMLAQRYEVSPERSGATVLVSTAASVVTLALLLGWLG
ncbi:AEC family transporter [Roseicella aquatilis]|uniref:AEC family transporter n=1 Tax=Roseicella aquatilis TaxID=2527868 RepID=A0A4R4D6H8_9PROT|nr:AEC family transporter [Roseicella aquatilis]TCZ55597.1 AEC family transporter [Roseicella aquatilis]